MRPGGWGRGGDFDLAGDSVEAVGGLLRPPWPVFDSLGSFATYEKKPAKSGG